VLKKKNVDEMEALRVENMYMKQKLKEENTMSLNSTRECVETSTRPNLTTVNSFEVSHKKPRFVSRDVYGTSIRKHPFF